MDRNDQKAYVYDEAANGLMVRIPVDRYADWKATQDRIRRGEKVEIDPEITKRLAALMKGEEIADFEKEPSNYSQQTTARPVTPPSTPPQKHKLLDIITSKRAAAVFSIILCITLYFGLLENVFTKKVDTLIVYTQEESEYIHGVIYCDKYDKPDGSYGDKVYRLDHSKPIICTTLYDCPDKIGCCLRLAQETTTTAKDYISPLLISIPISGIVFYILTKKGKAH